MATSPRPVGELAAAADHFEQELARYERLSSELARTPVHSEKSLGRKRRLLEDFSASEVELGAKVATLGERARDASQPAGPLLSQADGKVGAEVLEPLGQVSAQIHGVLLDADAIASAANDQNWPEVARDVKNLRQQLNAMHAKITRLREDVAKRALS